MPTFIDESGNTGRIKDGGSTHLHLAAVWVPTLNDAELFREKIRRLRRDLGVRDDFEFKFARTHQHPEWRRAFFAEAIAQEFRCAVSSIDKGLDGWNAADGPQLHRACAAELAALMGPIYHRAEERVQTSLREPIVVDDNDDRNSLTTIRQQFRGLNPQRPGKPLIGYISFRESAPEPMLQLADMVCGATANARVGQDPTWYGLIAERDVE